MCYRSRSDAGNGDCGACAVGQQSPCESRCLAEGGLPYRRPRRAIFFAISDSLREATAREANLAF
jgi:hypothetical protein